MGTSRRGTKLQTQTWREWVPDTPDLDERAQLTRDQVLSQLQHLGIKVTPRALSDWQTRGVVPRPWTRTIAGKKRVTTFPWWIVDLIVKLQAYLAAEDDKFTVSQLSSRMRFEARLLAAPSLPDSWGGLPRDVSLIAERFAVDPRDVKLGDFILAMAPPTGPLTSSWVTEELDDDLAIIKSAAKRVVEYAARWGIDTARVELHLTEKSGKVQTLPVLSEEDTGKPSPEALSVS